MKKAIILCLSIIISISVVGTLICLYLKYVKDNNTQSASVEQTVVYPIVESLDEIEGSVDITQELSDEIIEEEAPEEKERVPLFNVSFYEDKDIDNPTEPDFEADNTDYSQLISFTATENITNVKVLGLSAECISDDGEVTFQYAPMFEHSDMKAGDTMVILMELPEIIPLYAVSYVSEDGYIYYDSVNQSGEDGSVYLNTYEVHPLEDEQTD